MFQVKITDLKHFYELKVRLCANNSKIQERLDFKESYSLTTALDLLRLMVSLKIYKSIEFYFTDTEIVFQTNSVSNANDRQ